MFRSVFLNYLAGLMLLGLGVGCKAPAQMVWSPDGSVAAYRAEDRAAVIDADGKVLSHLGRSSGGYAWTADSKTLYFAGVATQAEMPIEPDRRWWKDELKPPPGTQPDADKFVTLAAWSNRKVTPLATFRSGPAIYMALSPDQNWLAVLCSNGGDDVVLYAYHLPGKRLWELTTVPGLGLTFTGPNRLAFIDASHDNPAEPASVVEVTLNEKSEQLERRRLLSVLRDKTLWMVALGDNLLLTAQPLTLPGTPVDDDAPFKLFMFTRANGGVFAVAEDVGPLFAVSPDGSRVLIEKITPKTEKLPEKRELMLIRANGSDGQVLRTLAGHAFHLWPAWRGDNEIAFTAAEARDITVGGEPRKAYDVLLYTITDKGELQAGKKLSESWDPDLLPFEKVTPTTQKN